MANDGTPNEGLPDSGMPDGVIPPPKEEAAQRRDRWNRLKGGEFKDLYTEDTQRLIDRRFRETKQMEARLQEMQPLIETMQRRYDVAGQDLAALAQALAQDETRRAAENERQNELRQTQLSRLVAAQAARRLQTAQRVRGWSEESRTLQRQYPDFSLDEELRDPAFCACLQRGDSLRDAYVAKHHERLLREGVAAAEQQVVERIRAQGRRAAENGADGVGSFTSRIDVSRLSRKERAEIARRVERGERISF